MIFYGHSIDGEPAANWPAIQQECGKYAVFIIEVRRYNPDREITRAQMAWLHCENGPIACLSDYMGCSRLVAEVILKKKCGSEWFIVEIDGQEVIASKTQLSVTQTTQWIDNIFDWMESIGCPVQPPDPEWNKTLEDAQ